GIAILYALWLGFRGQGWWWLVPAIALTIGGFKGLSLRFSAERRASRGRILYLAQLAVLLSIAALWLRLVLVGGLYGLYKAVFVQFNPIDLLLAAVALIIAYHFSKAVNALFNLLWV